MKYSHWINRIPLFPLSAIVIICMISMLWIPHKFNIPAWSDDWVWISIADQHGLKFPQDPRPFAQVPSYIGYMITPDSFLGINLVLAVLLILKSSAMYLLLRQLFKDNPAFAFIGAVLVSLYPGDIANFEMMTAYIHLNIVAVLVALNLLIVLWKLSSPNGFSLRQNALPWWGAFIGMSLALGLIYEVSYPIILASPLLLLWLEKKLTQKVIVVALLWYVMPIILLLRILLLAFSTPDFLAYQTGAIATNNNLSSILSSLWIIYSRMFWSSWAYTIPTAPQGLSDPLTYISLITFVVSAVMIWLHLRTAKLDAAWRTTFLILIAGVVIFFLGFALYIPSKFRDSDFRTLLVSFMGSSISAVAVVWIFANFHKIPRAVISLSLVILGIVLFHATDRFTSIIVIALAIGFLLEKRVRVAILGATLISLAMSYSVGLVNNMATREQADYQHQMLESITTAAPRFSPNTVVLLTAPSGENKPFQMLDQWRWDVLTFMLQYVYHDSTIYGYPCDMTDGKFGYYGMDCHLKKDYAEIDRGSGTEPLKIPYDQIVIFDYQGQRDYRLLQQIPSSYLANGQVTEYDPLKLIDQNATPPNRVQTIYAGNNSVAIRSK